VPIILGFYERSCVVVILPIVEFEASVEARELLFQRLAKVTHDCTLYVPCGVRRNLYKIACRGQAYDV